MPSATSTRTASSGTTPERQPPSGAEFTVYNRSANPIWHDANGDGRFRRQKSSPQRSRHDHRDRLQRIARRWTARQASAPLPSAPTRSWRRKLPVGYTGRGIVSHGEIREDGQFDQLVGADGMLNEVVRGGVQVRKDDLHELGASEGPGRSRPLRFGDAGYLGTSLEGIEFTVVNTSRHGVMVGDTYRPKGLCRRRHRGRPGTEGGSLHRPDRNRYAALRHLLTETASPTAIPLDRQRSPHLRCARTKVVRRIAGADLLWRDQVVPTYTCEGLRSWAASSPASPSSHPTSTSEAHVAVTDLATCSAPPRIGGAARRP